MGRIPTSFVRIAVILAMTAMFFLGCRSAIIKPPAPLTMEAPAEVSDRLKAWVAEEQAKTDAMIGKEAAKRSLASAARGVGWFAGIVGVMSVGALIAGSFFGGIGRKSAFMGLAIAGAGIWLRYFILAHGFLVSEALSWAVIAAIFVAGPIVGIMALRAHWIRHTTVRALANKRLAEGDDADDVMAYMPVSVSKKKQLSKAWDMAMSDSTLDATKLEARKLLAKYKLPVPNSNT